MNPTPKPVPRRPAAAAPPKPKDPAAAAPPKPKDPAAAAPPVVDDAPSDDDGSEAPSPLLAASPPPAPRRLTGHELTIVDQVKTLLKDAARLPYLPGAAVLPLASAAFDDLVGPDHMDAAEPAPPVATQDECDSACRVLDNIVRTGDIASLGNVLKGLRGIMGGLIPL